MASPESWPVSGDSHFYGKRLFFTLDEQAPSLLIRFFDERLKVFGKCKNLRVRLATGINAIP